MADHSLHYLERPVFESKRKKSKIQWILASSCIIYFAFYTICCSVNILVDEPDRLFIIPRGCTLHQLKNKLKKEGYIKNETTFLLVAYLLRYNPRLAPGQYRLTKNMSNWQAVKMLRGAMQQPVKITFSTQSNKRSLVKQLVKHTGIEQEALRSLLNDAQRLATYGFTPENILTMFIPDTYEVYWTITAEQLLSKMYAAYQHFWNTTRRDKATKIQLSPIAISILASIVQSETNNLQEAAMIAGVYLNRLKRKMPIQSCPTLIHALKDKNKKTNFKRVLLHDTYINSPYNSYRNKGLPPGPIALPSVAAIDAVLNYVKHDHLFFSAKEDFSGLHYFTHSFEEHKKNASRYKRVLNKKKVIR